MSKSLQVLAVWSMIVTGLMVGARSRERAVVPRGLSRSRAHTRWCRHSVDSTPTRDALDVSGLGSAGEDGVAVKKAGATSWTAHSRPPYRAVFPLSMSWSALADGRRIGSALMQQTGDEFRDERGLHGRDHQAHILRDRSTTTDSSWVRSAVCRPRRTVYFPVDICRKVPEFCEFTIEFHTLDDGACMVKAVTPQAGPVRLPNGAIVTGNELRLVEEVRYAGHYPYLGFDTMTMQSDVPSFAILSETLR